MFCVPTLLRALSSTGSRTKSGSMGVHMYSPPSAARHVVKAFPVDELMLYEFIQAS